MYYKKVKKLVHEKRDSFEANKEVYFKNYYGTSITDDQNVFKV